MGQGGGVVNGMVGQGSGMVDSMVGQGGVDERGGVVDSVVSRVGNGGGVGRSAVGGGGVDDGVLDEGLVGAGDALVLHVSVVLRGGQIGGRHGCQCYVTFVTLITLGQTEP